MTVIQGVAKGDAESLDTVRKTTWCIATHADDVVSELADTIEQNAKSSNDNLYDSIYTGVIAGLILAKYKMDLLMQETIPVDAKN